MPSPYFNSPVQGGGESLPHAVQRMRNQGFTTQQIAGQIKRWHPGWTPDQITGVLAARAETAKPAPTVSSKPFRPGQKPDAYRMSIDAKPFAGKPFSGNLAAKPVYANPFNAGPSGDQVLKSALGGPAKGQTVQQSQQQLAAIYRENHPVGQQIIQDVADTLPGVALAKAVRDGHVNAGALASEAFNDLSSGLLPVGKAAGLLGGLRGLKALRDAADTAKAVEAAKVPGAADDLRGALKGARVIRGKQEAGYSAERAARFAKAKEHLNNQALAPDERVRLAKSELKGELPKINFKGFNELNDESLRSLQEHILNHPYLMEGQKIRASDALTNALSGKVPTRSELTLLEHVFGKDTANGLGKVAAHPFRDTVLSVLNIPRSLMASFDLSAPFRQGLVVATRHPAIFGRNFRSMVKAFGSENVYRGILDDIHARPTYPMMLEAKLSLADLGKAVGPREERFASDAAERIPVVGRGVRASGRAYTGYLDKTRADVFDHLIAKAQAQGINVQDGKFLRSLGTYINSATGRGNLGHFQEAGKVLNTFFFSPRLLASRLNFLNPVYYAKLDPFARKEALRSAVQLAGTLSTLLALASRVPGVSVVTDPRNPDWGKIKFGHTRFDLAGGFQQPLRLLAQLATGVAISSTTGKKLNLTANGFGQPTRLDLFLRFFEGKESPWASVVTDWLRNSNQVGQTFSWKKEAVQHMTPLLAQDAADLYNDRQGGMNGLAAAFAGYGIGTFGVGIQTYGPTKPKAAKPKPSSYFSSQSGGGSPYFQVPSGSTSGGYFGR